MGGEQGRGVDGGGGKAYHGGMFKSRSTGGFTLVEALASCLLLAVGAVVVCGLSRRCLVNSREGMEYEQAYRLVDECLDRVAAMGLAGYKQQTKVRGDFGERYEGYRYKVEVKEREGGVNLWEVRATVVWGAEEAEKQVSAMTLLYDWRR